MSLLTRIFSNNNKEEDNKKESCIELSFKGKFRINQELLIKILPWLLASLLGGVGAYTVPNMMSPSNAESNQRQLPGQLSLVEQEKQQEKQFD